jgi:cytochrome c6
MRWWSGKLAYLLVLVLSGQGDALAADVFKGERIYLKLCVGCHGNGRGGQVGIPGAPDFARGQSLMRPDGALLQTLRSGKNAMPSYLGVLDDYEMLDVIAYLRTIR